MFEATLVELQEKPSFPDGIIGMNAFGEKPSFVDKGIRLRGILSAGRQDINPSGISCATPGAEILGASSDHLLVDLTEAHEAFKVGDSLRFRMDYSAILGAFTSGYVGRRYV
jgi:predicted amino acid racemase